MHSERAPWFLKLAAWGGVIFLHFPLAIIAIYAFNTEDAAFSFPPKGLTLHWFSVAASRGDILDAVTLSLKIAALATLIALVLGTLAAAALWRSTFFGKNAISLLLLLPIALPGIMIHAIVRPRANPWPDNARTRRCSESCPRSVPVTARPSRPRCRRPPAASAPTSRSPRARSPRCRRAAPRSPVQFRRESPR